MITKAKVRAELEKLPEEFSMEELFERLLLLEKIEQGEKDSMNGNVIREEDLKKDIKKWFKIEWTGRAQADFRNIADYIELDSPTYAELFTNRLVDRTQVLKQFIYAGRIVPEQDQEHISELIAGNYRIIYKIINQELIHILAVSHAARKL